MDVFGPKWENHARRLKENWERTVSPDDVVILAGDFSWGMSMGEALEDFRFVEALPGRKLLVKGNHDYWWGTASKIKSFFAQNGIESFDILHNNAFVCGDAAVCATRGWVLENGGMPDEHDKKIFAREMMRLEMSLKRAKEAGAGDITAVMHYPPLLRNFTDSPFTVLMRSYGVRRCLFGHLHGAAQSNAVTGLVDGIDYRLIAADYIDFCPRLIALLG